MLNEFKTGAGSSFDQVLRWPSVRSMDWTRTFVASAEGNANIIAIIAIGSAVRPNVSSTDLDLLAICRDLHSLDETPPIEVDLRAYALGEINPKIEQGHDLLTWALKFGRSLFQRQGFWDRLVNSWQSRLPLPSSRVAMDRAASVYRRLTDILELGDEEAAHEQTISYFTHLVRAELLDKGVFPASRPELPGQLLEHGPSQLADGLRHLLVSDSLELAELARWLSIAHWETALHK